MEPVEKNDGAAAPVSDEQKADLAALSALAADAPQAGAVAAQPVQNDAQEAEEWGALPAIFGNILAPILPELREVYSPAACKSWGAAMVPVARKYGWTASTIMGPEVALACASLPFIIGTTAAIKRRRAEAPKPAEAQPEAAPAVDKSALDALTPGGMEGV